MQNKKDSNQPVTQGEFRKFADDMREFADFVVNHAATKEDLKGFAIKDDLERFATKDDLERFATKNDLERFATKDDLERFATKKELHSFREAAVRLFASKEDLLDSERRLEVKITNFKDEVLTAVDAVMGEVKTIREERAAHVLRHDRVDETLAGHEKRLKRVETHAGI